MGVAVSKGSRASTTWACPGPKGPGRHKVGASESEGCGEDEVGMSGFKGSWRARGGRVWVQRVCMGARWACPGLKGPCEGKVGTSGYEGFVRVQGWRIRVPRGPCVCKVGTSGFEGLVRVQDGRVQIRRVRAGVRWACPGLRGLCGCKVGASG